MKKNCLFALLALIAVVGITLIFFIGVKIIRDQVAAASCSDERLTLEEKANCGTHTYELEEALTSSCLLMDEDSGVKYVTIRFSGSTMTTSIHNRKYTKVERNTYESVQGKISPDSNIDRHVYTVILTLYGFTENYAYEGSNGNLYDCWFDTYTTIE